MHRPRRLTGSGASVRSACRSDVRCRLWGFGKSTDVRHLRANDRPPHRQILLSGDAHNADVSKRPFTLRESRMLSAAGSIASIMGLLALIL